MTDGSIAVLGAGNAGRALAGDLARLGAEVVLWNRTPEHISEIADLRGIELEGVVTGFGKLRLVTSDMGEAIADSSLLMVCVPAFAHREVAREAAAHFRHGRQSFSTQVGPLAPLSFSMSSGASSVRPR